MTDFPSPRELKEEFALGSAEKAFIKESRAHACEILAFRDRRLALIVGPCSIHEQEAALLYADKLARLAKEVEESCFIVMRGYVEKPRTAVGWKGLLYDPHLDGSHLIEAGLKLSRGFFLELAKRGVPAAMEFVDPLAALYFEDLITWGFIGARTSSSQPHRQIASSLPFPVGFKNGLDGDIERSIHNLHSATSPHAFLYISEEGRLTTKESYGNPSCHLVLRGGSAGPNYDRKSVAHARERLTEQGFFPRILIDCAHGNSQKEYVRQKEAFYDILEQIREGDESIAGMMLESYIHAGSQSLSDDPSSRISGVSITDPCLDWASTEELILSAADLLSSSKVIRSSDSGTLLSP